ncbi:MAG: hypothetical protein JXC36_01825 [Candidatus Atribacteria bacterium]|nr:hypothetical protein [Candidatus Atribacteria bacterium]
MINWTMISALIAMFTAIIAILALYFEQRRSRLITSVELFWRSEEKFRHDKNMLDKRKKSSSGLLEGIIVPELDDILDYFELIGFLVRKGIFDPEMAWNSFHNRAVGYWFASENYISKIRSEDPTIWEDYEYLINRLNRLDAQKTRRSISFAKPSTEWLKNFLDEESRQY